MKTGLIILLFLLVAQLSAQRHYHQPRVKVSPLEKPLMDIDTTLSRHIIHNNAFQHTIEPEQMEPVSLFPVMLSLPGHNTTSTQLLLKTSQQNPVTSIQTQGVNKSRAVGYYISPKVKVPYSRVKKQKSRLYKNITTVKKTQSFWRFLVYGTMGFGSAFMLAAFLLFLFGFVTIGLVFLIIATVFFVLASFLAVILWAFIGGWRIKLGPYLLALTLIVLITAAVLLGIGSPISLVFMIISMALYFVIALFYYLSFI